MFHFRLETLLRLRIAERDQRRADLAKALRAEEAAASEQRQIERESKSQVSLVRAAQVARRGRCRWPAADAPL